LRNYRLNSGRKPCQNKKGLIVTEKSATISNAFKTFMTDAPEHANAWGTMVQALGQASALDPKTGELAYIAVLAALNRTSGIPFHVLGAKQAGATREEIISAILVGLPAAGHVVTQSLPPAMDAFDRE
jgi:alkylhydroperoxidase/carboxymuconolactone decarboxylase family protein YurZ